MGAGILPTTIHNNKLYFLFGKENKYEDSAPGFSDFGGGTDSNESLFDTAVREAGEELTGFLGNDTDIKKMLKNTEPIILIIQITIVVIQFIECIYFLLNMT